MQIFYGVNKFDVIVIVLDVYLTPVIISWMEFCFIMIFIMIVVTITGDFMVINYLLIYTLGFLYIK